MWGFPPVSEIKDFVGGIFLLGSGNLRRSDFDHLNLFKKLKTAFCDCQTSIKFKISMTCVYKEYKIKTKWYRSNDSIFYWVMTWTLLFRGGGGIKFLVGESLLGGIFLGGGGISKFLTGEGGLPPIPSVEKTLPDILYKCHKVNKDDIKFRT